VGIGSEDRLRVVAQAPGHDVQRHGWRGRQRERRAGVPENVQVAGRDARCLPMLAERGRERHRGDCAAELVAEDKILILIGRTRQVALEELHQELGALIVLDGRACASVLPELEDVEVSEIDHMELAASCAFFIDAVKRGRLRHLAQRELTSAIDGAVLRPLGDQFAFSRKSSGTDISPLIAVAVACGAWRWSLEDT
jgi:hypothetical protein